MKTVKKQLRYATFEIWDEFTESKEYKINSYNRDKDFDFDVTIFPIKGEWQHIKRIIKNELILRKNRSKEFSKKLRKKVKIHGKDAYVSHYKSLGSDHYAMRRTTELCFVPLNDNTILVVEGTSLNEFFQNGLPEWEKFYTSFKTDMSGTYKTEYGSFTVLDNMRDSSYYNYFVNEQHPFSIKVEYLSEADLKGETPIDVVFRRGGAYYDNLEYTRNTKSLIIDGKHASYEEIDLHDKEIGRKVKMIKIDVTDDLNPGLRIELKTDPQGYEMYRDKFECFLKSIRFDR